jgi:hypothetical protein
MVPLVKVRDAASDAPIEQNFARAIEWNVPSPWALRSIRIRRPHARHQLVEFLELLYDIWGNVGAR